MRTSTLASVLLLLGSLNLTTACSTGTPTADSARGRGGPSSSPSSTTGTDPGGTVDMSKIKGIRIVSDTSDAPSCRWATGYPDVPGATAMTAAMKRDVEQRVRAFLGEESDGPARLCGGAPAGTEGARAAELNISFSFLVASGDVLGVRLTTFQSPSAGDGTDTRTYWYDGRDRTDESALALIADDSRSAFVSAVRKQLEKRLKRPLKGQTKEQTKGQIKGKEGAGPTPLEDTADRIAHLDDMAFTADGGLRVALDRGAVGAPTGGRHTVTLPRATVAPWLSGFGRRAQRQTVHPGSGLDLGATSTPTAPVPTHTADGEDSTDCAKVTCVALTFDDGPASPHTATLLTYLAAYDARATFFTVGQNVAAHPELVRAQVQAGHEVGNHSWSHPDLTRLTPAEIRSEVDLTSA
ncbi:polysaccharide deacetylase family protein, partial [Streptomyces spongiae]